MKVILQRLVQDPDKSFIVYHEKEPFFSSPWHYHPEYELVLILKSTGKRIIGDHIEHFQEGDLFFIGTALPHVFDNDPIYLKGDDHLEAQAIVIQFLPDFLGKEFFNAPEFYLFSQFLRKSVRGMKIHGLAKQLITDKMKCMPEIRGLERLTMLLSIFDILAKNTEFELLASSGFTQNFDAASSERISKITKYIMKNFTDDITLSAVAEVANMTPTNFCTFFKNFYRQTFVEYLNNIRIGHACRLLCDEDKNISEIAYESGFTNMSNFNRQFKKYKGVNPARYRSSLSNNFRKDTNSVKRSRLEVMNAINGLSPKPV